MCVCVSHRYDVLITTDQPSGVYWISVHHQYTLSAAPSAYALLRYTTATSTNDTLPVSPTPQAADVQPWTSSTQSMVSAAVRFNLASRYTRLTSMMTDETGPNAQSCQLAHIKPGVSSRVGVTCKAETIGGAECVCVCVCLCV